MWIDQLNEVLSKASVFWVLALIAFLLLLIYSKLSSQKEQKRK